jgi:hypothetical protein
MGISKFSNSNFYGNQKTNSLKVASLSPVTTRISWTTGIGFLGVIYDVERSLNSKNFQIVSNAAQYRLKSGSSLPSGMTLNTTGLISGVASEVGSDTNYNFTVEALTATNVVLGERDFNFTIAARQVTQYTTNGSFTYIKPTGPTRLQVLMIGGPGGGGNNRGNGSGGWGGGGGIVFSPAVVVPEAQTSYSLVVGYAGGSSCCNNQAGCSGQATTGFDGKAGSGGGGQSEFNGNCNFSPYDPTSVSISGTTTIFNATSGGCSFGANNGAPSITSSITGSSVGYSRGGGSNRGDGSGCATLVSPGLIIVRS